MTTTTESPAGRELDLRVATDVMGWKPAFVDRSSPLGERLPDGPPSDLDYYITPVGSVPCGWSPSTDIAAAWQVAEAMRARWAEQDNAKRDEPDAWQFQDFADEGWGASVIWLHHDGPIHVVIDIAPTLPLAICRAALAYTERVGAAR